MPALAAARISCWPSPLFTKALRGTILYQLRHSARGLIPGTVGEPAVKQ